MEYQPFHITVRGLVVHQGKLLLMVSKDPENLGAIETPGGRIDKKELLINSLRRELKEELDLDLSRFENKTLLFAVNQRDEIEYGWDNETQIMEIYYLVKIPDQVSLNIRSAENTHDLIWIATQTNLDEFPCKLESCRKIYKDVQKALSNNTI